MTIANPKQLKKPLTIHDFSTVAHEYLSEDSPLSGIACFDETLEKEDFRHLEVRMSSFEKCAFSGCHFEKASFVDVLFRFCDLSNSIFRDAYFERCQFISCKCIGVDMSESRIKNVVFRETNLRYASFDKTGVTDVFFDRIDFSDASVIEASIKNFTAVESKFIRNNFFKTPLSSMDFTRNELLSPIVSMPPSELKGAILNPFQAADLIGLWGIIVKND